MFDILECHTQAGKGKVMKTILCLNVIKNSKYILKCTSRARSSANRHYSSLSNVLKQIKKDPLWNAGFSDAFAVMGIKEPMTLTPALLRTLAPEMFKADKDGKLMLALWGMSTQKDDDGNPTFDEKDKVIKIPVQRIVKAWTPNKVLQLLAQSAAFRAQSQEAPIVNSVDTKTT